MSERLDPLFFQQDVLVVAPSLLGKVLVRRFDNGTILRHYITETEAYRGEEDLACHASKGRTARTAVMYEEGGLVYVYLIYGMYWMLNFVTGIKDKPQAVLIRGIVDFDGPGKLTKYFKLNKSFYGEDLFQSNRLWVEDAPVIEKYNISQRIGVDYAGEKWKNMPWRFYFKF